MNRFHKLNPLESQIIEHKGTERPFSHEYDKLSEAGVYVCRKCDYPLYLSENKFNSRCGWPSFDEEIKGHVDRKPDADGERTEILCARCHGHLGHVFIGEHLTNKNTRHCVNSLSMRFLPAFTKDGKEIAVFAGGCFWGVEHLLKFLNGVLECLSGYIGGHVVEPSYEEVCTGVTGHVEACYIVFDPKIISYETLLKAFFEIHDFTQKDGQGPDHGPQYLSRIFVFSNKQKETAFHLIEKLKKKKYDVATKIEYGMPFYKAEDYHQRYYERTGKTPYCHKRVKIF